MKHDTKHTLPAASAAHNLPIYYPPLDTVTRPTLSTAEAAYYLHLRPQTMRAYACHQNFAITPTKIQSRLHWKTSEVRALLSGKAL